MKPSYTRIATLIFCLLGLQANAQFQGEVYKYDSSVKVYDEHGTEKTLAWCGGFNNPQFAMGDLNHDGKQDLVIFERSKGLRTFINTGITGHPNYVYAPKYEKNFPGVEGYLILADYNCDGVPDLWTGGFAGVAVWTGYYTAASELSFKKYKDLSYNTTPGYSENIYVSVNDVPAVVDIDNDGDLDVVAFNDLGANNAWWYKNMQVEDTLPCDSLRMTLADAQWGRFNSLGHSGNCMSLIDMDGDGDKDMLDGHVLNNRLVYRENGKYPYGGVDSMISVDTAWGTHGYTINLAQWPAPFNVDIDQDGLKDLVIAPNGYGENYKCVTFMKNKGTAGVPDFVYQSDTFLVDKTIDCGQASFPFFYDYDKDGKPDLFIGSDGYYGPDSTPSGTLVSRITYYKNTSTPGHPSFTLQSSNFMGLDSFNFSGASIAIGDIDNDGKDDLVLGHSPNTASFSYFKNFAASNSVQPIWKLEQKELTNDSGNIIKVGGGASPCIYDIDKDGKPDLVSGCYNGSLYYYKNISTSAGTVNLKFMTKNLGDVSVDKYGGRYSTPFIGKIDNSSQQYLLCGSSSGLLYRYTGFQHGNVINPYLQLDTNYSFIDSSHLLILNTGGYYGFRSAPAIADIDGDGKYEMVVGNVWGGLKIYKQDTLVSDTPSIVRNNIAVTPNVFIYPNPAKTFVSINWNTSFADKDIHITLVNVTGQKVAETTVSASAGHTQLSISNIPAGMYYCILRSEKNVKTVPLSIIR